MALSKKQQGSKYGFDIHKALPLLFVRHCNQFIRQHWLIYFLESPFFNIFHHILEKNKPDNKLNVHSSIFQKYQTSLIKPFLVDYYPENPIFDVLLGWIRL